MADEANFWIASMETPHTNSMGFGTTPEQALASFVEMWVEKYCPVADADVGYLWEYKEDITIGKATTGSAVMLSGGDDLWFKDVVKGDDPKLAPTLDALAERYGIFCTTIEEASAGLRNSFAALASTIAADGVDFEEHHHLLNEAMDKMSNLVSEDPGSVDAEELATAAVNLRDTFDALRLTAVTDWNSPTRDHRREHARSYQTMSFNVKRLATAIFHLRETPGLGRA